MKTCLTWKSQSSFTVSPQLLHLFFHRRKYIKKKSFSADIEIYKELQAESKADLVFRDMTSLPKEGKTLLLSPTHPLPLPGEGRKRDVFHKVGLVDDAGKPFLFSWGITTKRGGEEMQPHVGFPWAWISFCAALQITGTVEHEKKKLFHWRSFNVLNFLILQY